MPAERTCVVTRAAAPREDLVRLVASPEGVVVLDYRAKLPGRGAWMACSAEAVAGLRRVAGRVAHQLGARVDADAIALALREAVGRGVEEGLSQAAGAGALVYGHDAVRDALQAGRIEVLLVASDASPRTVASVTEADTTGAVPVVTVPLSAEQVGARTGRGLLAVAGVTRSTATRHLLRQLRRHAQLG